MHQPEIEYEVNKIVGLIDNMNAHRHKSMMAIKKSLDAIITFNLMESSIHWAMLKMLSGEYLCRRREPKVLYHIAEGGILNKLTPLGADDAYSMETVPMTVDLFMSNDWAFPDSIVGDERND